MDKEHWALIGKENKIAISSKIGIESQLKAVQLYTIYRSVSNGEMVFVLHFNDGVSPVMQEDQIQHLIATKADAGEPYEMDEICAVGNRIGPARATPFLPDRFVYNYAVENSKKVRGESPVTFEEFLRVVNRQSKPSEPQSVHSPGVNQQFTSAAAIMAEPTKVSANPEDAPSPPRRAPRKRPGPKVKEEEPSEEPSTPKRKVRAAPTSEPKRRKTVVAAPVVAEDPINRVIAKIGERVKSHLDKLSPKGLQKFKSDYNYKDVTNAQFTLHPPSELDTTTLLFAIVYLWSTRLNFKLLKLGSEECYIDQWPEIVFKTAAHYTAVTKKPFEDLSAFAMKGICYRYPANKMAAFVYHSSMVKLLEHLSTLEDDAFEEELTAMLKSLNESNNSKRLILYCDALLNPEAAPEPDQEVETGDF